MSEPSSQPTSSSQPVTPAPVLAPTPEPKAEVPVKVVAGTGYGFPRSYYVSSDPSFKAVAPAYQGLSATGQVLYLFNPDKKFQAGVGLEGHCVFGETEKSSLSAESSFTACREGVVVQGTANGKQASIGVQLAAGKNNYFTKDGDVGAPVSLSLDGEGGFYGSAALVAQVGPLVVEAGLQTSTVFRIDSTPIATDMSQNIVVGVDVLSLLKSSKK